MKIKPALDIFMLLQSPAIITIVVAGGDLALDLFTDQISAGPLIAITAGVVILLFKRKIVRFVLSKVKYPGIFYDICERRSMLDISSLDDPQSVLDDLYHPQYSTAQFLSDNQLANEISNANPARKNTMAVTYVAVMMLTFGISRHIPFWVIPLFLILVFGLIKYLVPVRAQGPIVYTFSKDGLSTANGIIPWQSVYNWSASEKYKNGIAIQFVEPDKEELTLYPYHLTHSEIEILMLLAHYKYKYGEGELNGLKGLDG